MANGDVIMTRVNKELLTHSFIGMEYVYRVSSKEGYKYFQTYHDAHAFHLEHPELDDDFSSLVSSKKVEQDSDGFYILTKPWGIPQRITIEPSADPANDDCPIADGEEEDCCSDEDCSEDEDL